MYNMTVKPGQKVVFNCKVTGDTEKGEKYNNLYVQFRPDKTGHDNLFQN